jgi:spoIIIJ-associated protein
MTKLKTIESLAKKLFTLIGSKATVSVKEDKDNEAILVNLESTEETGLLIGRRGETLNSLQTILGMMARQKLGEWVRVIVNVGDWREKQENYLEDLANEAALKAKETGEAQPIYNLSAGQRRIIHLALADDSDVETVSQGEGGERFLLVKPK